MGKYIYINYAYEDRQQVMAIVQQMEAMGIEICHDSGEEKVAESGCVVHFCTAASRTSKSYRKVMNYALKHEKDTMLFHLDGQQIVSDVETQMDVLYTLFKCKCRISGYPEGISETVKIDKPESVDKSEQAAVQTENEQKKPQDAVPTNPAESRPKLEAEEVEANLRKNQPVSKADRRTVKPEEKLPEREKFYREGRRLMDGDGCEPDSKEAFAYFKQAANQGHTEAQYQLSICYDSGIGVRKSMTEAAKWRQMAAYGGHVQAQCEIGYCYEYGQGVVRNIREAVRWYQIASEQGNVEAKNNLAFCYQKGRGVAKNMKEAIRLYQEAADAGNASAQYNLGFCYWYGEGVRSDKEKAIELFGQSADNGNAKAGQMLKILNQRAYMR